MDNNKVSWVNVIKFAGAVIAFLIGAGFATGQEVLQYFAGYGYEGLLVGGFVLICFVYLCSSFMCAGYDEHFPNTNDIYRYYCGKYIGGFYDYFSIAFIYMSYIVMLGGAGGTFNQYYHLPPAYGAIFMLAVSVGVVILGLGKIVDVHRLHRAADRPHRARRRSRAIITNPGGIAQGVSAHRLRLARPRKVHPRRKQLFMSGFSYVGFCLLWLAAFCALWERRPTARRKPSWGATLGATDSSPARSSSPSAFSTQFESLYASDIPSLILAEKLWPPLASIFSVVILAGIFTTAVPLLWTVSARFAQEKTTKFYALTAGLGAVACFVALMLPFRQIVNIIYGINGYVAYSSSSSCSQRPSALRRSSASNGLS